MVLNLIAFSPSLRFHVHRKFGLHSAVNIVKLLSKTQRRHGANSNLLTSFMRWCGPTKYVFMVEITDCVVSCASCREVIVIHTRADNAAVRTGAFPPVSCPIRRTGNL
eukprot:INCI14214.1.p1 GENE.INCI14214.1~~INCI14214.1.p1  ORF type:complete len:108 (-),score=2.19 INCI14214.1:176-499(-)